MVAHGFTSPAIFYLANVSYMRFGRRNFLMWGRVLSLCPYLSLWWALGCLSNMGVPPTINLIRELEVFVCFFNYECSFFLVLLFLTFISVCYRMYLYNRMNHGQPFYQGRGLFFSLSINEYLVFYRLIVFPLLFSLGVPVFYL